MSKKTVAQLDKEVQQIKKKAGNLHVQCLRVWNTQQIKETIDKLDKGNRMIKVEITSEDWGGSKLYDLTVFLYPPLDRV